jgi:multiple sugar transport system ATP-binding protein
MNFVDATVTMPQGNTSDGPQLDAGSFTVSLPQKHSAALQNYAGKTVVVGVRPEDIHDKNLLPTNMGAHSEVRLQVDVVEPMGAISTLYLTSGQHTLIATVEAETTAREGGVMDAVFDTERVHVFDKETEQKIV